MSSRHVGVPGWRFVVAVLALLLLPVTVAAAIIGTGLALLAILYGFIGAGGSQVGVMGLVTLAIAVFVCRLCIWMRAGRKILVRHQRMLVGGFMTAAAPLATWLFFASTSPALNRANWICTGVYALFGIWLIVDAWEDRGSL